MKDPETNVATSRYHQVTVQMWLVEDSRFNLNDTSTWKPSRTASGAFAAERRVFVFLSLFF